MLKSIYPRYPHKHGMSWCALAESRSFAKNRSRHLVLPIKLTDSHKERHLSWDHLVRIPISIAALVVAGSKLVVGGRGRWLAMRAS